jgi:NAD(P)H-dependent FMN reductase
MKTQVILSSTRDGRVSERIAKWVVESAKQHSDLGEIELVDLKDFDLPFMNESTSPKYNPNRNLTGDVKRFLDTLDQADAFIFVSPEYNRSMPGVLKNALDYVGWELNRKPAATVTHGGAGGYGASENIRCC